MVPGGMEGGREGGGFILQSTVISEPIPGICRFGGFTGGETVEMTSCYCAATCTVSLLTDVKHGALRKNRLAQGRKASPCRGGQLAQTETRFYNRISLTMRAALRFAVVAAIALLVIAHANEDFAEEDMDEEVETEAGKAFVLALQKVNPNCSTF